MTYTLADGDNVNFRTAFEQCISLSFGTAEDLLLKLWNGDETVVKFVNETSDLFDDCDKSHTNALLKFPGDNTVTELVTQWTLVSLEIHDFLASVKVANEQGSVPIHQLGMIAVIHSLLTTRRMTFALNGQSV